MKKIMFNDLYGLTKAVIDGYKTMTRRIVSDRMGKLLDVNSKGLLIIPRSSIPDCMTPEQFAKEFAKYSGVIIEKNDVKEVKPAIDIREECIKLAPYKVGEVVAIAQAYKDIETDHYFISQCHANEETVSMKKDEAGWTNKMFVSAYYMPHQIQITDIKIERLQDISTADCIAEGFLPDCRQIIFDKVCGKGTWNSNPWVFAYSFKLIK